MADSKKISELTGQTTIAGSALLTFVNANGENVKITLADFKESIGSFGSLKQSGSPTGSPILSTGPTVSLIRNIEAGNGINAGLSAQNGVEVSLNAASDTVGQEIVTGINATQPVFRSLSPGTGIQIAENGNNLVISATGALPTTKTVTVNVEADFPTAVSGVITLAANTVYLIANDVSTASRFVLSDGTSIVGHSAISPTLTYTGSATMFTGVDTSNTFAAVRFDCPSAKVFDISDTAGGTRQVGILDMNILSCDSVGTFGNLLALSISNSAALSVATTGIDITGSNWSILSISKWANVSSSATFVGIDLGTSIHKNVELENLFFNVSNAGAIGVSGLSSSGNMTANTLGVISNSGFIGGMQELSGLNVSDIRWNFSGNTGIADSRTDGLLSMQGNATNTVITVAGTPVLVAGTWVVELDSQMTGTTGGRLTFDPERPGKLPITAQVSVAPSSGTNIAMAAYVAIDGTIVANSKGEGTASSGSPTSITIPWQRAFSNAQFLEVFVANEDNTTDLLVSSAKLRVN